MHIRQFHLYRLSAVLACALTVALPTAFAYDDGFFDDVQVDGSLTVDGSPWFTDMQLMLGTYTHGLVEDPVFYISAYGDSFNSEIVFGSNAAPAYFEWQDSSVKMELSATNELSLLNDTTADYDVILNPNGDSYLKHNLVLDGTDNQMPNQTIVDDDSILNIGLADDRYAPIGSIGSLLDGNGDSVPDSIVIGNGSYVTPTTSWGNQIALGDHTVALSEDSVAIGNYNTVDAWASTAVGSYNHASGYQTAVFGTYSRSLGYATLAVGNGALADEYSHWSMALGMDSWVHGDMGTTLGWNSVSTGWASMALGEYTEARGNRLTVMGRLNLSISESTTDEFSNPLFVIGNGEYADDEGNIGINYQGYYNYEDTSYPVGLQTRPYAARSNALVIRKNGSMDVIAHSSLASGAAVLSVKDGSANPASPVTKMFVDKEGDVHARGFYASDYMETEYLYSDYSIWSDQIAATRFSGLLITAGSENENLDYSSLGSYAVNETTPSGTATPNLAVGAGSGGLSAQRANAMVVRKSGDVDVAGALRVPPAGDLSMGSFTSGRDPRAQLDPNAILPSHDWGQEE